jgi:hypothetical protein
MLQVARGGPCPSEAECVVVGAHGASASLTTWRVVGRELDDAFNDLSRYALAMGGSRDPRRVAAAIEARPLSGSSADLAQGSAIVSIL